MEKTRSYLSLALAVLPCLAFTQTNWAALEPGGNGARYAINHLTKAFVTVNGKVMQDSVPQTIQSEIEFRVVDELGPEKIGAITFNKVEIPGFSGTNNRLFKEFLELPTYLKVNRSFFNTKIFEKAVDEGTIFENFYALMTAPLEAVLNIGLPSNGFEAGAQWQLTRLDTIHIKGEMAVVASAYSYQVVGFKDTLGFPCAIVNYQASSDQLPVSPEMLALAEELDIINEYSSTIKGRLLVAKATGLPISHKLWRKQKMLSQMEKETMNLRATEEIELVALDVKLEGERSDMAENLSEYYQHNSTRPPAGSIHDLLAKNPKIKVIAKVEWDEVDANDEGTRFWLANEAQRTLIDAEGRTILPPGNYSLSFWAENDFFEDGYGVVKLNKQYEIITKEGTHLPIDKKYETVAPFYRGRAVAKLEDKYGGLKGLIDANGKDVIVPAYSEIDEFNGDFAKVSRDSKQGIIDLNGKVIEPLNANIIISSNRPHGFTIFDKLTKKQAFLPNTPNGKKVENLDSAPYFKQGIAYIVRNKKYGAIDSTGTSIIPTEYDYLGTNNNGGITVAANKQYGLFNRSGKLVIPIEFEKIAPTPAPNLFVVGKDGRLGLMATDGSTMLPIEFTEIEMVQDGVWKVAKAGKEGLVSTKGETLVPLEYDWIACVNQALGWVRATKSEQEYLITNNYKDTKPLTEQVSRYLPCDMESNISVQADSLEKYGLYDIHGNLVLPNEYDAIVNLPNNLFIVEKGGLTGIVDNKGQFVQPLQQMEITQEGAGGKCLLFSQKGRVGLLDGNGKIVLEPLFDEIEVTKEGNILVELDGLLGILKLKG